MRMMLTLRHEQINLVETTFRALGGKGDTFVAVVYKKFFEQEPEAEAMFSDTDFGQQHKKLLLTLIMIVDNLRDMPHIEMMLQTTIKTHDSHAITQHHYDALVDALIETFSETLKGDWSVEAEEAWRIALAKIVVMLQKTSD